MDRLDTAREVAARLAAAEAAIDEALRTGADLLSRVASGRREIGVAFTVGGEVFARSTAALSALTCARAEMAACHDALARVQIRAGLGAAAAGEGSKDGPPDGDRSKGAGLGEEVGAGAVRRLRRA